MMSPQTFRRRLMMKTEELRKVEEDVIHIIIGGAREGSKTIDSGLKLATISWQRAGLLSPAFGESAAKRLVSWQVTKSSQMYRVYEKSRTIAKATVMPRGKDGAILIALQGVDWLERFMTEAEQRSEEQQPSLPGGEISADKKRLKRNRPPAVQDNEMEQVKKKTKPAKKKTKPVATRPREKRRFSRVKKEKEKEGEGEGMDKRPSVFGLEELNLEDHAGVRNAASFSDRIA